ncbi:unnamed protein product, partial [Polarella glacialis]
VVGVRSERALLPIDVPASNGGIRRPSSTTSEYRPVGLASISPVASPISIRKLKRFHTSPTSGGSFPFDTSEVPLLGRALGQGAPEGREHQGQRSFTSSDLQDIRDIGYQDIGYGKKLVTLSPNKVTVTAWKRPTSKQAQQEASARSAEPQSRSDAFNQLNSPMMQRRKRQALESDVLSKKANAARALQIDQQRTAVDKLSMSETPEALETRIRIVEARTALRLFAPIPTPKEYIPKVWAGCDVMTRKSVREHCQALPDHLRI